MGFEISGKPHSVEFTIGRIVLYERAVGHPIVASVARNAGLFTVEELATLAGYGLRSEDGEFASPSEGKEAAMRLIEEAGYRAAYDRVAEALLRDCGFLFKASGGKA